MKFLSTQLDTQQIEVLGRSRLVAALIAQGFELAVPMRDVGVDLIVYRSDDQFAACPIQMKASLGESFSVHKKYGKFPSLVMAYVWYAHTSTEIYLMRYDHAIALMGQSARDSSSWQNQGIYAWTKIPSWLREALLPHRNNWDAVRSALGYASDPKVMP